MKWKTALPALLLAASAALFPALAADAAAEKFPAVNDYAQANYADVAEGMWYADGVKVCYETGLLLGTQDGFSPDTKVTVAEEAVMAARVASAVSGLPVGAGENWYQPSVDFLESAGIYVPENLSAPATRGEFFRLLSDVLPAEYTAALNAITALPDTQDVQVLRFYNAGILTGTDEYGTFQADGVLSRAEAATMLARVARPELRVRFTVQEKPAEASPTSQTSSYEEELANTMALSVNGQEVPMNQYVGWLNRVVEQFDQLLQSAGLTLDWNADYGVDDLPGAFREQAKNAAISYVLREQKARQLGCKVSELPQTLFPDPSQDDLRNYLDTLGYMAAKHILISTVDVSTGDAVREDSEALEAAQILIDALDRQPTEEMFDDLMSVYGEDPGMRQQPEGYLFTSGEMVTEFEDGVKSLNYGEYTKTPVRSAYGYHIIWRVDPMELVDADLLTEDYQNAQLSTLVNTWISQATVTANDALIDMVNVQATYEAYLKENQ